MASRKLTEEARGSDRDDLQVRRSEPGAAYGAPDPDDPRKPDSPTDLTGSSWKGVLKRTVKEFNEDQCTDSAAALTYYALLALFPALIAMVSLIGLVSDPQRAVDNLLQIVSDLGGQSGVEALEGPISNVVTNAAGAGIGFGLLGAIWSASGYVGAFSRAMNRIYEVEEGRPFWKMRPLQLLITVVGLVVVAAVAIALVATGPVAQSIGDVIGLGDTAVTVWNWAKWPVLVVVVALLIAGLYYATPNVRQPKFHWISMGSFIALLVWVVASLGFGFYVANFSSYGATYGSLAGVVIFLLWLWITNLALLFGAEFDAETERGRQLQAGIPGAEDQIQLPPRDTKKIDHH
ncbi:YihY/virulence factor BrkB family protein [Vallicoccus soli]|uniref:YihY/virulence factor BrkB family protein n=1 Tax=Vallicoccus soli TaxID=2339232 RepID=UPI001402874F|nr:YihY/virulence factor BrkB family protein [Vallicoccus soli]